VPLEEVRGEPAWAAGLAGFAKDHRWYEIVADTLAADFDCRALVLEDERGVAHVIQPLFLVDQDVLATAPRWVQQIASALRKLAPRLLKLRILMLGCAAGEGRIAGEDEPQRQAVLAAATEALAGAARHDGARLVVWKDFPAEDRPLFSGLTSKSGGAYTKVASMPATRLPLDFASFDDYMERHLSRATRKNLRRKFRATRSVGLEMSAVTNVADVVDEVLPLYEQVRARSKLQFERLNREFLLQLGERMPDRTRFFLWRLEGRLVAFSLCMVHEDAIYDEYLGLDYSVALDLHLYFVTFRDIFTWALGQGLKTYFSTPLNYEPKLHLGFSLVPLDLYAAQPNPLLNALLRRVLPWIQPARQEKALQRFANAAELEA
jgi:hypothetical protein